MGVQSQSLDIVFKAIYRQSISGNVYCAGKLSKKFLAVYFHNFHPVLGKVARKFQSSPIPPAAGYGACLCNREGLQLWEETGGG